VLLRFDPFRDVDRLFAQLGAAPTQTVRSFPMDAVRRGDQVVVQLDLPGIDPGSIDVTTERGALTIRAERRGAQQEGDQVLVAERPQGTFTRQIVLGENLDVDALHAAYDQGVLTITIPVAQQAKPRRVEVTSTGGGQPQTIEGTANAAEEQRDVTS
jgi:HSP20 family protein